MTLDFALVRDLPRPTAWFRLPTDLETRLAVVPEVQDRALAVLHFAHRVELDREHLLVDDRNERRVREAYLRAALSEFASLDEAAEREFKRLGVAGQPPRQALSPNPLTHAFRLLRHLNVHLERSTFTNDSRPASIRLGDTVHDVDYPLWLVDNFTVSSLSGLRDARHYSGDELQQLVSWFNEEQREWGVPHMILQATRAYCEDLLTLLLPAS